MLTSFQNAKVKDVARLRKRRNRGEGEPIVIEGEREVARAVAQGVSVHRLYYCLDLASSDGHSLVSSLKESPDVERVECSREVFEKLAYREGPDGILALADPPQWGLDDVQLSETPLVLVVEHIEKPGNLGTLLRSADAVNADAVLVCDPVTDLYNPNVIRASTGTLFSRPVVQTTSAAALAWLTTHKLHIAAALPDADLDYFDADLSGSLAVVLGAEHAGLSQIWKEAATVALRIPMCGQADSLNVSAAGVLFLYEALRQRRA